MNHKSNYHIFHYYISPKFYVTSRSIIFTAEQQRNNGWEVVYIIWDCAKPHVKPNQNTVKLGHNDHDYNGQVTVIRNKYWCSCDLRYIEFDFTQILG